MKKSNIIIVVCLAALCLVGWLTIGTRAASNSSAYSDNVKKADDYVSRGLYQRAIASYELALEEKETKELYEKINAAYLLRFDEAPEATLSDYMDFLQTAVDAYPGDATLVDSYVQIYSSQNEYKNIYDCLINAVAHGYDEETAKPLLISARYAFDFTGSVFYDVKYSDSGYYTVSDGNGWNIYSDDNGYLLDKEYSFISSINEDGIFIATGEDSRIYDTTGMTYGIFENKVIDSGMFSEGLVAANCGNKYSYYNDLAEPQFGEYDAAGSFQNGKAAVKTGNQWYLIDTNGKAVSDKFSEILLDSCGRYVVNGKVIAKAADGTFGIYDEDMKLEAKLDCSDADIYSSDGLTAVCVNEKWGFADSEGKIVIEPEYSSAKSFSNGLAAVCKNGVWGFIDKDNTLVIDYQFADTMYMSENGTCFVCEKDVAQSSDESAEQSEKPSREWQQLELELGILEE